MKLKCINDQVDVLTFWLSKRVGSEKVPLTIGKSYEGSMIAKFGESGPSSSDWHYFLCYDDNGEWKTYPLKLFKPE